MSAPRRGRSWVWVACGIVGALTAAVRLADALIGGGGQ